MDEKSTEKDEKCLDEDVIIFLNHKIILNNELCRYKYL